MHTSLSTEKIGFEIGWFSGNDWLLFQLDLCQMISSDVLMLFSVTFLKFSFGVWIQW